MITEKTILVVEDEIIIRNLLIGIFANEGLKAIGAETAERALALLETNDIALITLDLQLPEMSGLTFLDKLSKAGKNIPVVIISGNIALIPPPVKRSPLVKQIIPKPFKIPDVISALKLIEKS